LADETIEKGRKSQALDRTMLECLEVNKVALDCQYSSRFSVYHVHGKLQNL